MSDYKFKTITPDEIIPRSIERLATRPNRPAQYGEGSLSAEALKKRFDDLAKLVIEKYNAMATILSGKDALKYLNLPSGYFWSDAQNPSIADLLTRIINGSGNVVAVDPVEKSVKDVSSIAESLYTLYTEILALATSIKDDMLPTKQDNLSFDGKYNAETNKAATVGTVTMKVAEIVANAPEDFNTLKELSDWLTSHEVSAASMNTAIRQNASDIAEMKPAIERNSDNIAEVTQKVNSLPDEITFAGLPDKPFDGTEAIDITVDRSKGSVALKSGRTAYFQTEKTYTVDEFIGAEVRYQNDSNTMSLTVSRDIGNSYYAKIVDETPDGVTIKAMDEYIFIAYTTNYTPSQANTPFPNVGVYFSDSGDYYIVSLSKIANPAKRMDGAFVKMYKHSVGMYTTGIPPYLSNASFVFLSPSPKPVNTIEKLKYSPACFSSKYGSATAYPISGAVQTSDYGSESEREVSSIWIPTDNSYISVIYITAYTTPPALNTSTVQFYSEAVTITDYVTEV